MLYFHPYEFSATPLRAGPEMMPEGRRARARAAVWFALQGINRARVPSRVQRVLRGARTVRAIDLVDALDSQVNEAHSYSSRGAHAEGEL